MAKVPNGQGIVHEAEENQEDPTTAVPREPLAREVLRSQFISKATDRRIEKVTFFGIDLELRQPSYESVVKSRQSQVAQDYAAIQQVIENTYIPDTNERFFEPEDFDMLKDAAFGTDWIAMSGALTRLTDVNFPSPKTDSGETPTTT